MMLSNDLSGGGLQGSVLFAQSTVIPSQASALPGDSQPHLAAGRKTLVLFKPLGGSTLSSVDLKVMSREGQVAFQGTMKPPIELPQPVGKVEAFPKQFFEPDSYGYVVSQQSDLSQMIGDPTGSYLRSLLNDYTSVKIVTSDGNWAPEIYLPDPSSVPGDSLVVFNRRATLGTEFFYGSETIDPPWGDTIAFKIVDGIWVTPGDLSYDDASIHFAVPSYYDLVVSESREILRLADDPSGAGFLDILAQHDSVQISMSNGHWGPSFFLPQLPEDFGAKTVTFVSKAAYHSFVNYRNDQACLEIVAGDTRVFKSLDGEWGEWSDTQYGKLRYGDAFWSAELAANIVQPGMELHFTGSGSQGGSGRFRPVVGAASELLLHTIDLGLLTTPRGDFPFQTDSKYHQQYFQQVPVCRLTVNEYEPVQWSEITLQDGVVYHDHSVDEGTVYTGDLRENIAKELIGLGICNANYGVFFSGVGESSPYGRAAAQITVHNTVGNYRNGLVVQGLSGGLGRATLVSSRGNEFSHELGHNYGLGHYEGGFLGSVHKPAGDLNSTWGWDSELNAFIPNFGRGLSDVESCVDGQCQLPFNGHTFAVDAMAGGEPFYPNVNDYTLYTPYTLKKIQAFLEQQSVFDPASPTGYRKWDANTEAMLPWGEVAEPGPDQLNEAELAGLLRTFRLVVIARNDGNFPPQLLIPRAESWNNGKGLHLINNTATNMSVDINGSPFVVAGNRAAKFESNGISWGLIEDFTFTVVRKPSQQGVPAMTLLAFYDPDNNLPSYVYPALYGGYCNIFQPSTDAEIASSRCYLEVTNASSAKMRFALRSALYDSNKMNRIHVNVPTSFGATVASVFSDGYELAHRNISPPVGNPGYTINGLPR